MASKKNKNPAAETSGFSEIIERFKTHPFLFGGTVLVLVIVIIAFVLVPPMADAGKADRGGSEDMVFGYYDGKPIGLVYNNYFDQALRETARMAGFDIQDSFGGQNYEMAYQVWYEAFIETLVRMGMLDEMKKSGYEAPSREIESQVAKYPDFQEDGRFSIIKYKNYDKNKILSLLRAAEDNYAAGKYMESVVGLKISSAEKAFIAAMAYPERTFELVTLPRSAYPDTEMLSFAAASPALFRSVHFSRITVDNEKEGRQVLESVQSGKSSFEDAARNHSTDINKDSGGDMGLKMAYELFSELAEEGDRDKVLSLKQGELSPLLKVPAGTAGQESGKWIFFRAEVNPFTPDLAQEENLAKVRSYMNRFEGGRMENWLIARTEEFLSGAQKQNMSLAAYIESLQSQEPEGFVKNAVVSTVGPVNLNYGNMGGGDNEWGNRLFSQTMNTQANPELAAAVSNEHFWKTAFSIPLNAPSAPFTLGNSIAVLCAVAETAGDETSAANIAAFYAMGWMYNTANADIRGAFFYSDKFENNFNALFWPMVFRNLTSPSEKQ